MKPKIEHSGPFVPRYTAALEGYIIKFVRRSWPSMAHLYEFEDLLQEAYLVFLRCKRRFEDYGDNSAALFTAYFKQALMHHFASIHARSRRYNYVEMAPEHEKGHNRNMYDDPGVLAEYRALLRSLPKEMMEVLTMLTNGERPAKCPGKATRQLKHILTTGEVGGGRP